MLKGYLAHLRKVSNGIPFAIERASEPAAGNGAAQPGSGTIPPSMCAVRDRAITLAMASA